MMRAIAWSAGLYFVICSTLVSATETTTFTYDELGRVISSSNSGGPRNGSASQTRYDPAGNREAISVGQPLPPPVANASTFSFTGSTTITEGGTGTYTIARTGTASSTMTLNLSSQNGSAAAPDDFNAFNVPLIFQPWETVKNISVATLNDTVMEPDETFSLNLSTSAPGASLSNTAISVTIPANGTPPNNPPVAVSDNAGSIGVCLLKQVTVTSNDTDPDGNYPLSLVSATGGALADASVVSSTDISINAYGTPGQGTVTYTVADSLGAQSTGTVSFTVTNGNGCARVGGG